MSDEGMPSLLRKWSEADWAQFSRFHNTLAMRSSRRVPLSKVFGNLRCGDEVRARIAKLNPQGATEGQEIRGWWPAETSWRRRLMIDGVGPQQFIARFGRSAYRAVPRTAFVRSGHRKLIRTSYIAEIAHG